MKCDDEFDLDVRLSTPSGLEEPGFWGCTEIGTGCGGPTPVICGEPTQFQFTCRRTCEACPTLVDTCPRTQCADTCVTCPTKCGQPTCFGFTCSPTCDTCQTQCLKFTCITCLPNQCQVITTPTGCGFQCVPIQTLAPTECVAVCDIQAGTRICRL